MSPLPVEDRNGLASLTPLDTLDASWTYLHVHLAFK